MKNFIKAIILIALAVVVGFASYKTVLSIWGKDIDLTVSKVNYGDNGVDDKSNMQNTIVTAIYGDDVSQQSIEFIVVSIFNINTKNMDYLFFPKRAQVTLSEEVYHQMSSATQNIPQTIKLGNVGKYFATDEDRYKYTSEVIGDVLGVKVDHYETISSDNFTKFIDLIDPVEYDVPQSMKFKDVTDAQVYLKKGKQTLVGNQVVGMLSDMNLYKDQETGRIMAMENYFKNYATNFYSIESRDAFCTNLQNYYSIVQGNVTFDKVKEYVDYWYQITPETIRVWTVPGEMKSFYVVSSEKAQAFAKQIVENQTPYAVKQEKVTSLATPETLTADASSVQATATEEKKDKKDSTQASSEDKKQKKEEKDSKKSKIQILNSTTVTGLAAKWKTKLQSAGYQISSTGNYKKQNLPATKIIVKEDGMGKDLLAYFPKATIEVGTLPANVDVQIIIGASDKKIQ